MIDVKNKANTFEITVTLETSSGSTVNVNRVFPGDPGIDALIEVFNRALRGAGYQFDDIERVIYPLPEDLE